METASCVSSPVFMLEETNIIMTFQEGKNFGDFYFFKPDLLMWLFLVALTLPHTNPPYLNRFPICEMLLNAWRLSSFLVVTIWVFLIKKKISLVLVLISIWEIFLLITTIIHQGDIYKAAAEAFSVLSIVFLYDAAYDRGTVFLSSQLFCFEAIIYANLITEILYPRVLFPNGMYVNQHFPYAPNWFLGYYNGYAKYCVPALMFAWLYMKQTGKKCRSVCLLFGIILSAVLVFAGGFTLTLASILIAYGLFKNRTKIFHYYTYWSIHFIFFLGIIVFKLQNLFFWLINDLLGKWYSLVVRIRIWNKTLQYITESFLIGHGVQSSDIRIMEYRESWAIHSHNMLLEILYQGGMIGLGLWIAIVITAGIGLYRYRNAEKSKIIATAFLGWCVATLVEPFATCFLMGMFVIAYYGNCDSRQHSPCLKKRNRKKLRFTRVKILKR